MARKRFVVWPWVTVAVIVAMGTAAWQNSDLGRASGDLERQRAAAKREGVPIEWTDLVQFAPPLPDEDNAAIPYGLAFDTLKKSGDFKGVKLGQLIPTIADGSAKPTDVRALQAALKVAQPSLDLVKQGAARKGLFFNRQWDKGAALLFPEYAYARHLGQALVLRAMLAKTPLEAAQDLRTAARLRAHIGSEPVLIAELMANGIEADVHQGIRYLGRRGGSWTTAVAPVLDDLGKVPTLRRSLASEAVWGAHFGDEIQRAGGIQGFSSMYGQTPSELRLMGFSPVRRAMEARVYEYWRNAWKSLPDDPTDFRRASAALKAPTTEKGPSYAMLQFLLPVFDGFAQSNARAEADRRLTRSALELWSGKNPALPNDPFGIGPLHLKRKGSDWTLYSVGPDGLDQGGKVRVKGNDATYDMVVRSR